jgi:Na+-transporting NADH:ubiquinone oxidoreductase subunit A
MAKTIQLKKGFDINLVGKPEKKTADSFPETYALKPSDFHGLKRPKLLVEVGDNVKAGTPIFFDKMMESVKFTSPVSGEVVEIIRGEKRKLLEVRILADSSITYETFPKHSEAQVKGLSREAAQEALLNSGVWPQIIQRPFGVIANPADSPKNIFISTFDTHPLAPDYEYIFRGQEAYFQTGIEILRKFTSGKIHLGLRSEIASSSIFSRTEGVEMNKVSGPHPAGNVGIQIHHIDPINKGDIIWTLNPYGVIQIGKLFTDGVYDASKIVALTGSEVKSPQYYKTFMGAAIKKMVDGNLKSKHVRFISGNPLTGEKISEDGYVGFYSHQLTVLPEGDEYEFLGWILPSTKKLSVHRAFGLLSFLNPKKEYVLDTNTQGQHRAFVMSGAFEKVTPMDILPTHLLKAIMAEDFDGMEALGIYEVVEEDLALCEFVDVSKHKVQSIVREGLDLIQNS